LLCLLWFHSQAELSTTTEGRVELVRGTAKSELAVVPVEGSRWLD